MYVWVCKLGHLKSFPDKFSCYQLLKKNKAKIFLKLLKVLTLLKCFQNGTTLNSKNIEIPLIEICLLEAIFCQSWHNLNYFFVSFIMSQKVIYACVVNVVITNFR